jgi:serine/threonine-protein kinase
MTASSLGSYELIGNLAHRGMVDVVLARQRGPQGFERLVVVKKLVRRHAANTSYVRQLVDEAKIVAALDHPNITRIHELGIVDGICFLALEFVHGQSMHAIQQRLARLRMRFPIDHVVAVGRCISAALHHAHERRGLDGTLLEIVHRDVSPPNILISYDGVVKLAEFGAGGVAEGSIQTRDGTLKRNISYMSPEQAKGALSDRRSDVFSLGSVLWELIAGQRLFKLDNELATIQAVIHMRSPPPSRFRPDCSPELDRIILRALEPDPDTRYQTAEELEVELEELAFEHRLRQSPIALRGFMRDLFATEIASWNQARAESDSTDAVTALLGLETLASENDDDGADDEDTADREPLDDVTVERDETDDYTEVEADLQPAFGTIESSSDMTSSVPIPPPVIVGNIDLTPAPLLTPTPSMLPPPAQPPASELREHGPSAVFPIAPADWLATPDPKPAIKPIVIVAVFVALFVLAIVLALLIP